jgi:para-nitrobenzyl esterase
MKGYYDDSADGEGEAGVLVSSAGLDRRAFLRRAPLVAGALAASAAFTRKLRAQFEGAAIIAKTTCGSVRGEKKDGILVFKGIPYAEPPTGGNRFKPAPKLKPWAGVRDALVYAPQCPQIRGRGRPKDWKPPVSAEDCLYLNVWTQGVGNGRKRPVMFYSHYGGFTNGNGGAEGSPENQYCDGAALARDYDVVVVTHNHRLGIMGYLYLGDLLGDEYAASGITGMLDIVAALEWVRDNIEHFGGDSGTVMIWGESGGGAKTSVLTAMPSAQGLYHRASIESGPVLRMKSRDAANEATRDVLTTLNLTDKQAGELLKVPPDTLIEVMQRVSPPVPPVSKVTRELSTLVRFSPMVDGHYLPVHPYDPVAPAISAKVPLIVGTDKDETLFLFRNTPEGGLSMNEEELRRRLEPMFHEKSSRVLEVYRRSRPGASPAELFVAITTAEWMVSDAITLAERKAALNADPVYMYEFAFDSPSPAPAGVPYRSGSPHGSEVPFKFDHVPGDPKTDKGARAAKHMSRAWATFARNGNPSHDGIPVWPPYTLGKRSTMIIDAECRVVDDPHREERLLWKELP